MLQYKEVVMISLSQCIEDFENNLHFLASCFYIFKKVVYQEQDNGGRGNSILNIEKSLFVSVSVYFHYAVDFLVSCCV